MATKKFAFIHDEHKDRVDVELDLEDLERRYDRDLTLVRIPEFQETVFSFYAVEDLGECSFPDDNDQYRMTTLGEFLDKMASSPDVETIGSCYETWTVVLLAGTPEV